MGHLLDIAKRVNERQEKSTQRNELNEKSEVYPLVGYDSAHVHNPLYKQSVELSCESFAPLRTGRNASWSPEIKSCIDWFLALEPPAEPFFLQDHVYVLNPVKFFESLRKEIGNGPTGIRARLGTLQSDLIALKAKFSSGGVITKSSEN